MDKCKSNLRVIPPEIWFRIYKTRCYDIVWIMSSHSSMKVGRRKNNTLLKWKSVLQAAVDTKRMMPGQKADTISILHFNDVYNVESREVEPVGGAARWLFLWNTRLSHFVSGLGSNKTSLNHNMLVYQGRSSFLNLDLDLVSPLVPGLWPLWRATRRRIHLSFSQGTYLLPA